MRRARATVRVPGPVSAVEALWYDQSRWPAWVEGFGGVSRREGEWPEPGAAVVWDSKPGGRGRVVERVAGYEARTGQALEVEDGQLVGSQRIAFVADGADVEVELVLEYALKAGGPFIPVADVLFIRRSLRDSLRRTLQRFAHEREGDAALADG